VKPGRIKSLTSKRFQSFVRIYPRLDERLNTNPYCSRNEATNFLNLVQISPIAAKMNNSGVYKQCDLGIELGGVGLCSYKLFDKRSGKRCCLKKWRYRLYRCVIYRGRGGSGSQI
jgi:hypothetical protein